MIILEQGTEAHMIISHKHKFIFIHIPKTAGSSICETLIRACGYDPLNIKSVDPQELAVYKVDEVDSERNASDLHQHATYQTVYEYFMQHNWSIEDYFVFSFLRNPWDWYVSIYCFNRKIYQNIQNHYNEKFWWAKECWDSPFDEWIKTKTGYNQFVYLEQDNKCQVDFLGKTENIQSSFNVICDRIGLPYCDVSRTNTNPHNHYSSYYNTETVSVVEQRCAKEIDYYKYKFTP